MSVISISKIEPQFQQTGVGFIPTDWEVRSIGSLFDITAGGDLVRSDFSPTADDIYCFPIYANALRNHGLYGFSGSRVHTASKITVAPRGEVGHAEHRTEDFCAIGRLLVLSPKGAFSLKLISEFINNFVEFALESTGVPQLTASQIAKYCVALPSTLHEQEAIAEALSDADALIESLESLIVKKRAIKQGAMQELLSGRRRLAGFSGAWHEVTLGEISHIKTGSRNNQDKVEGAEYPFFVRSESVERIDTYSYDCEAILIPGEGGIGSIFHYIDGRFDAHQRVYVISRFSADVSGRFVHLFMTQYFGPHAMQNTVKATVDSLRLPTFQNFVLHLPPTKSEQQAIASVLSEMSEEIEALNERLTKARRIKQGMMQDLLTGKVRLV